MREKLLLIAGILLVLYGAISLFGVGSTYYLLKPSLDSLPKDLESIFSAVDEAVDHAETAAREGISMLQSATELGEFSSSGWKPFGDIANSIRSMVSSVEKLEVDIQSFAAQVESTRNLVLGLSGQLRLVVNVAFVWLTIQQIVFIALGLGLLSIRRSTIRQIRLAEVVRRDDVRDLKRDERRADKD